MTVYVTLSLVQLGTLFPSFLAISDMFDGIIPGHFILLLVPAGLVSRDTWISVEIHTHGCTIGGSMYRLCFFICDKLRRSVIIASGGGTRGQHRERADAKVT
jgi:hypothetical protein